MRGMSAKDVFRVLRMQSGSCDSASQRVICCSRAVSYAHGIVSSLSICFSVFRVQLFSICALCEQKGEDGLFLFPPSFFLWSSSSFCCPVGCVV